MSAYTVHPAIDQGYFVIVSESESRHEERLIVCAGTLGECLGYIESAFGDTKVEEPARRTFAGGVYECPGCGRIENFKPGEVVIERNCTSPNCDEPFSAYRLRDVFDERPGDTNVIAEGKGPCAGCGHRWNNHTGRSDGLPDSCMVGDCECLGFKNRGGEG